MRRSWLNTFQYRGKERREPILYNLTNIAFPVVMTVASISDIVSICRQSLIHALFLICLSTEEKYIVSLDKDLSGLSSLTIQSSLECIKSQWWCDDRRMSGDSTVSHLQNEDQWIWVKLTLDVSNGHLDVREETYIRTIASIRQCISSIVYGIIVTVTVCVMWSWVFFSISIHFLSESILKRNKWCLY